MPRALRRRTELLLFHPRAGDLVTRARRRMEGEQRAAFAEVDLDGRLKAAVEGEQVLRELRLRPLRVLDLRLRELFRTRIEGEEEMVGVAHHRRTVELAQELEAFGRLRAALCVVAEADDSVDVLLLEVGQHCAERDAVPVDVREQGDAHYRLCARNSSRSVRVRTPIGRPSRETTTAFVRPVSVEKTSSSGSRTSIAASGGCIAAATSSCKASGFLKTRSRRSRSWSAPMTSARDSTSPSLITGSCEIE